MEKSSQLYNIILNQQRGVLTYGMTPPKISTSEEELIEIAERQAERIKPLPIDGIVLYDLQDEGDRTQVPRPFPLLSTVDPKKYCQLLGKFIDKPFIVYQAIGKYSRDELHQWYAECNRFPDKWATVLVGHPSSNGQIKNGISLTEAYSLYKAQSRNSLLGAVTIAERHAEKGNENQRIWHKVGMGCNFFISQAVYNAQSTINLLHDLLQDCNDEARRIPSFCITLTPCGSEKTMEFMRWLGVSFDYNVERRLCASGDMLEESKAICIEIAETILAYFSKYSVPIGFNIESVSTRKAEVEAATALVYQISELFKY